MGVEEVHWGEISDITHEHEQYQIRVSKLTVPIKVLYKERNFVSDILTLFSTWREYYYHGDIEESL